MEKYSVISKKPIEKEENNLMFKGNKTNILNYQDNEIILEKDTIAILPYFKDEGFILMKHEYNLAYQYKLKNFNNYKNETNFLTCITGSVEENESIIQAMRRELYEETGIVLSEFFPLTIDKKFFKTKNNISTYYPFLLEISNQEYKSTTVVGKDKQDKDLSKTIKIDINNINDIQTFDLITEYLLLRLKTEYNF